MSRSLLKVTTISIVLVFDCSEYRRRHMALYGSHDIFRADNQQGSAIRRKSAREAVQDAVLWLKDGNSVAVSYYVTVDCSRSFSCTSREFSGWVIFISV